MGESDRNGDALGWLSDILWPDGSGRLLVDRRRDRDGAGGDINSDINSAGVVASGDGDRRVGIRWWASPSANAPETLVPATSPQAARTAVRRYHDGFDLRRRARSWSAELLMFRPKAAARILDQRLVAATGSVGEGLLTDLCATLAAIGRGAELHIAITLSRPKSNRKPVLQLIGGDGTCVGWAKVGWNGWTKRLVTNEAVWLDRAANGSVDAPHVLGSHDLRGHHVVITSGVVGGRLPRRRSVRPPEPDLLLAIADLGTRERLPLIETPWWRTVESVRSQATDREAAAIERVKGQVESSVLEVGAWHGDLTPWNLLSGGRRWRAGAGPAVIDWEFAADGVPLGFDLCHFHTQVGVEMKGLSTADALDRSARLSPQGLAGLGVDPHNQLNIFRLYLVELIRRTLALRQAGMPVDSVEQGEAATARILTGPGTDALVTSVRSSRPAHR